MSQALYLASDPLLMAHPRCRDGSGLRRTPALVGLHRPSACRCQRLPADANTCLPIPTPARFYLPCRIPGDGYRVYARLETSKPVELSEVLELGLTPKENTGHVAPNDKS